MEGGGKTVPGKRSATVVLGVTLGEGGADGTWTACEAAEAPRDGMGDSVIAPDDPHPHRDIALRSTTRLKKGI
jgi:hypothetical protein